MPATDWIVQRDGNQYPATDVAMLRQWAATGNVRAGDRVWSPTRGAWSAATDTPEIAALLVQPTLPAVAAPRGVVAAQDVATPQRASIALRAAGYLIDVIPAFLIALIALIPLIGHIVAGLLLGFYWLYRDAAGFSLGKIALGLRVVQTNGEPASPQALKRRNLPFALAGFVAAIPLLGIFLGPVVGGIAFIATVVLLVIDGFTLGDKWAGTTVVSRS